MKKFCSHYLDVGILIIRLGLGLLLVIHGISIVLGGNEIRTLIGSRVFGASSLSVVAGLLAGLIMSFGSLFFMIGLLFPLVCVSLLVIMLFAILSHFLDGSTIYNLLGSWHAIWNAINLVIVFAGLWFIGPGRYAVCRKAYAKKDNNMKQGCCGGKCSK